MNLLNFYDSYESFLKSNRNFSDEDASPQFGPGITDDLNLTPEQRKAIEEGRDTASEKVIQKWPNAVIPYNIDCSLGIIFCLSSILFDILLLPCHCHSFTLKK